MKNQTINKEKRIKQILKEFNLYFNILNISKDYRRPILISLELRLKEMHDMGVIDKINKLKESK